MMSKPHTSTVGAEEGGDLLSALDERMRKIAAETFRELVPAHDVGAVADDDKGITAREAARLIGVSEWRVYEMVRRGALPACRPSPQRLRLRLGTVREFIRQGGEQKP